MRDSKLIACFGLIFSLIFLPITTTIQARQTVPEDIEELLLELKVERELAFDFSAILKDDQLYLPTTRLFSILGNSYELNKEQSLFKVRFPANGTPVVLHFDSRRVQGVESISNFDKQDFFIRGDEVYLHKSLVEELFGYTIIFDFRKLEIMLSSEEELHVIKRKERKERYRNFEYNPLSLKADIWKGGDHNLLNGWIMNWMVSSTHTMRSQGFTYGAGVGGEMLGGNFNMEFTGSKDYGIHWHDIRGRWKYPVYSSSLLTQFTAGIQSTEDKRVGVQRSFKGVEISNRPLSSRRQFDHISISNPLDEGWDAGVEVNGQLRGVALAEDNEAYDFRVPITYGSNTVTVNRFDTEGINHPRRYRIYVPQALLPPNEFEYNLSLGRYMHSNNNFGKLNLKWGLSPHLTIGGGSQYLTSSQDNFTGGMATPFFQMWSRLGNSVYLEGEHTLNYMSRASMRVIFPNSQVLSFNFKKFHGSSNLTHTGRLFDASMMSSFPISLPFIRLNTSFSAKYFQNRASDGFMNLYGGVSATLPAGFRLNVRSRGEFNHWDSARLPTAQQLETQFSISKRLFRKLLLRPRITYSHARGQIKRSELELNGRIFQNGNLGLSLEHNHLFNRTGLQLNFSLDLSFGRHSSRIISNYNQPSYNQRTSGTIAFNKTDNQVFFERRDWMNKAAIILKPFLDVNNNSRKDTGEPSVSGLKASVYRKGNNRPTYRDRSRVTRLTAYDQYIVRINEESLQNPLWSPKYKTYRVRPEPNQFTSVEVPIVVAGEAAGSVEMAGEGDRGRLYGIDVHIQSKDRPFDKVTKTYTGGEFYYVGLQPGRYIATLNHSQLAGRALQATKDSVSFTIESKKAGDIVEGLQLKVSSVNSDVAGSGKIYAIQVGAFKTKENAEDHAGLSEIKLGEEISVIYDSDQDLYKCIIRNIESKEGAEQMLRQIWYKPTLLYNDAFLIELPKK